MTIKGPEGDGEYQSFFRKRDPLPEKAPSAEGWVALCARAAVEEDPKKLLELVSEINRQLDARRKRLANEEHLRAEQGKAADGKTDRLVPERSTGDDGTAESE